MYVPFLLRNHVHLAHLMGARQCYTCVNGAAVKKVTKIMHSQPSACMWRKKNRLTWSSGVAHHNHCLFGSLILVSLIYGSAS